MLPIRLLIQASNSVFQGLHFVMIEKPALKVQLTRLNAGLFNFSFSWGASLFSSQVSKAFDPRYFRPRRVTISMLMFSRENGTWLEVAELVRETPNFARKANVIKMFPPSSGLVVFRIAAADRNPANVLPNQYLYNSGTA